MPFEHMQPSVLPGLAAVLLLGHQHCLCSFALSLHGKSLPQVRKLTSWLACTAQLPQFFKRACTHGRSSSKGITCPVSGCVGALHEQTRHALHNMQHSKLLLHLTDFSYHRLTGAVPLLSGVLSNLCDWYGSQKRLGSDLAAI